MEKIKAIAAERPKLVANMLVALCVFLGGAAVLLGQSCTGAGGAVDPRVVTAERDLCKARADYKLLAAAAGGAVDPKPGSPRAILESTEDALCADLPPPSPPAGSSPLPSSSAPDAAP